MLVRRLSILLISSDPSSHQVYITHDDVIGITEDDEAAAGGPTISVVVPSSPKGEGEVSERSKPLPHLLPFYFRIRRRRSKVFTYVFLLPSSFFLVCFCWCFLCHWWCIAREACATICKTRCFQRKTEKNNKKKRNEMEKNKITEEFQRQGKCICLSIECKKKKKPSLSYYFSFFAYTYRLPMKPPPCLPTSKSLRLPSQREQRQKAARTPTMWWPHSLLSLQRKQPRQRNQQSSSKGMLRPETEDEARQYRCRQLKGIGKDNKKNPSKHSIAGERYKCNYNKDDLRFNPANNCIDDLCGAATRIR